MLFLVSYLTHLKMQKDWVAPRGMLNFYFAHVKNEEYYG